MYLVYNEKGCFYSYSIGAEVIAGWLISLLVFTSGIWIRLIVKHKEKKGFKETEVVWKDAK